MRDTQSTITPDIPIACLLGDGLEREARQREVEQLFRQSHAVEEQAHGFAFHFTLTNETVSELLAFVATEHRCCPFLNFDLHIGPASGELVLRMSGGEGVKEFIGATFVEATP